jgi:hypothetical protein
MRSLLVLLALLVATERPAAACAVGSQCTKYRQNPGVVRVKPTVYTRVSGGVFKSSTRSRIVKFLTGSRWDPNLTAIPAYPRAQVVRSDPMFFSEARDAVRVDPHQARFHARIVLVRRIESRDGITMIEVDNDIYALEPCADKKRMCLTLRNDLSFEPVQTESQFSQPPASP